MRNVQTRQEWIGSLGAHPASAQMTMLFVGCDAAAGQVAMSRRKMVSLAKPYPILTHRQELPGVGPVRAITLYACLDTPWRFDNNPHKLWKYCGVGLERSSSGKDRHGRMKVGQLQLAWQVNRRLKNAVIGAALSAVRQGHNDFAEQYEGLVHHGLTAGNALHTVARKMLTVMWAMWKTGTRYDSRRVCG